MKSRQIPSPSLLRYLAQLTSKPVAVQRIARSRWQRYRGLCCSNTRLAARSPRASQIAVDPNQIWAISRTADKEISSVFDAVIVSPFVEQDLRQLGLRGPALRSQQNVARLLTTDIINGMKGYNTPLTQAGFYASNEPEHVTSDGLTWAEVVSIGENYEYARELADPEVVSQVIFILGYHFITCKLRVQQNLGTYMLKIATYMSNRDATLSVLSDSYRRKTEALPFAYQVLESLAKEGKDIGAMCLRAEMLMWPNRANTKATAAQRSEAYALTQRAFEMSEAGPPIVLPPPSTSKTHEPSATVPDIPLTPPWRLLSRMIRPDKDRPPTNRALWEQATEAGAREYDDPTAYEAMVTPDGYLETGFLLPFGSKTWVQYATKAAMHGSSIASFHLGRHFLQQHGWYPTNASGVKRDKTGFEWIELSVLQTIDPKHASRYTFLAALICRECGDQAGNRRWLEMGIEKLEEIAKVRGAAQGDGEFSTLSLRNQLQGWRRAWHGPRDPKFANVNYEDPRAKEFWEDLATWG